MAESKTPPGKLDALRQELSAHFSEGELKNLCLRLGIEYDDLPGGVLDSAMLAP